MNILRKDFIFQLFVESRSKYREEVENNSIPMTEIHATDTRKNCLVQQSMKRNRISNYCTKCNRKCVSKRESIHIFYVNKVFHFSFQFFVNYLLSLHFI